jgi:hypothetical protein
MHSFFKAPLALGLLAISSAPAFADPSGFVQAGSGVLVGSDSEEAPETIFTPHWRGSGVIDLGSGLGLQGDIAYQSYRFDTDLPATYNFADMTGALHLFYRDPNAYLVGGFVQVTQQSQFYSADGDDPYDVRTRSIAGAEGQVFLDNLTLYGQAGLMHEDLGNDSYTQTGVFLTGQARYFLTPDFKVDLHGMAARLSGSPLPGNPDFTKAGIGIGAEFKLPDSPLSTFAALDYTRIDSYYYDHDETRVSVGLKVNFGTGSLLEQDRSGASLNPVAAIPFRYVIVP